MAPDRLSALDATFLELEQADPSAHMHIGAVLVFAPPERGRPPGPAALRERLVARLDALPRYRQRLSAPAVGGLRFQRWEPDPGFDLDHHVERAALPSPGGRAELLDWAGEFYSHRLDRARPLWEAVVVEGLAGGEWALAIKVHHALVDGVGSLDAGLQLLDGAAPAPPPPPADDGPRTPLPLRAAAAWARSLRHPRDTLRRSVALADLLVRDELVAAPRTSLNVRIGEHRRLATAAAELDELRAIARGLGGTVNDVVLAAVTAGLRELLLSRGETPPRGGLRAMVPVDVRTAADRLRLGNRLTSLFVELPVDAAEPGERFERVRARVGARKRGGQALGAGTLLDLARYAPPLLHAVVARSQLATRLFNVTVTNVPGPQAPLHAFGCRLRDAIPLVPLAAEHAVGVAVLSFDGRVVFALNCDRDAVPDADVAALGIERELEALGAYAAVAAG